MALMDLFIPALFGLPPEKAHDVTIAGLKSGMVPVPSVPNDPRLHQHIAGLDFPNPLGLAAGFDKNAEVPDSVLKLGFGFTEAGTVTPLPQPGNPKPRIFRLVDDSAVINRLGFNNRGHESALALLKKRLEKPGIVGINIGANKETEDFAADYEKGIDAFYGLVSYFTVNISSPNTPGLRSLQLGSSLKDLLKRVSERVEANSEQEKKVVPVFLKIAPDLGEKDLDEIAGIVRKSNLSGLIISNTTIDREGLKSRRHRNEAGGLSGDPLFEKSTIVLAKMRTRLGDSFPLIGVGGISSATHAIQKMEAGANLLQLYTGMIYHGPSLPGKIIKGIALHLSRNNLDAVSAITNTGTSDWSRKPL